MRFDIDTGGQWRIPLSGDTRFDTGHELFHRDTGSGISCASCHPEGGDDGRRWNFIDLGARHTPALDVGLAGTEPFHWQGDLPDFTALVDEVFVARMGASAQSPARAEALGSWVFAQRSGPARVGDPDAVARGEASFTALGCDACHSTGAAPPTDFGFGFALQSPPLSGVGLHPPYMHDGRSATLADAVRDMVARTRPQQHPTAAEVADLVAYLQTL
jgi:mono/diheme cytochrome c family protein